MVCRLADLGDVAGQDRGHAHTCALELLAERVLQMVPRHRLVQRQRRDDAAFRDAVAVPISLLVSTGAVAWYLR